MRKNDYSYDDLNLIISERYTRLIDNASSISFNGKYYIPVDDETGEIMTYKHRTKCTVIIAYDSSYWCEIENNYYHLCEISKRENVVEPEKKETPINLPKAKYIPPANHPWRKDMKKCLISYGTFSLKINVKITGHFLLKLIYFNFKKIGHFY